MYPILRSGPYMVLFPRLQDALTGRVAYYIPFPSYVCNSDRVLTFSSPTALVVSPYFMYNQQCPFFISFGHKPTVFGRNHIIIVNK